MKQIKVRFNTLQGCIHKKFDDYAELNNYIKINEQEILAFQIEQ